MRMMIGITAKCDCLLLVITSHLDVTLQTIRALLSCFANRQRNESRNISSLADVGKYAKLLRSLTEWIRCVAM